MVHIYYSYINEQLHNALQEKYLKKFPVAFQEKLSLFRKWEDAQLSLLGRLLLDYGLNNFNKKMDECQLEYSDYNKPFFADLDLKFNISHSKNIVACAIAESFEVGIDIEFINEDIDLENFKDQMTDFEWEKIQNSTNSINAFYEYWTRKEAVVKADGKGLSIPLKKIDVSGDKATIRDSVFVLKEFHLNKNYMSHLAIMTTNPMHINTLSNKKIVLKKVYF